MCAMEPLYRLAGINPKNLPKYKIPFLEAELFTRIYYKLEEIFRKQYKNYFRLMNFTFFMENNMLETNFARLIIEQMLSSGHYTLQGIAHYTNTPEDIVYDIMIGRHTSPSAVFVRKLIELDRLARKDFYQTIIKESLKEELVEKEDE